MNLWYYTINYIFVILSFILFIVYIFTSNNVAYGSLIALFISLLLSILMMILNLLNKSQLLSLSIISFTFFNQLLPFIMLILFISFILYILFKYKNLILNGNISTSYYTFINCSLIIIFIQFFLILNYKLNLYLSPNNKLIIYILYFFDILLFICLNISMLSSFSNLSIKNSP
jgi:hypothetical protein